jgi:hypothetical protein
MRLFDQESKPDGIAEGIRRENCKDIPSLEFGFGSL